MTIRIPLIGIRGRITSLSAVFILAIAVACFTPVGFADIGDGSVAADRESHLEVAVLVDASGRSDIGAQALRRVITTTYDNLQPGDRLAVFAATRSAPTEVLVIVRRDADVPAEIVARAWRERAEPLAGRSADLPAGFSKFVRTRTKPPHVLVLLASSRLGSEGASSIWSAAKSARDAGAMVWAAGPDDPDLLAAARSGVFGWVPIDRADPASWILEVRRRQAAPSTADLQRLVNQLKETVQARDSTLHERDVEINRAHREIASQKTAIDGLNLDLSAATETRRQMEADLAAAKGSAADSLHQAEQRALEVQTLCVRLEEANAARQQAERTCREQRSQVEQSHVVGEDRLRDAIAEVKRLQSNNSSLQEEVQRLRAAPSPRTPEMAGTAAQDHLRTTTESDVARQRDVQPVSGVRKADSPRNTALSAALSLAAAGAAGGFLFFAVARVRSRRRMHVQVQGVWANGADAWRPFDLTVDPSSEVLSLSPKQAPQPTKLVESEAVPHLLIRGSRLEARSLRADCELMLNGQVISDTRARIPIGDEVTVRHPGGDATRLMVRSCRRRVPPSHADRVPMRPSVAQA